MASAHCEAKSPRRRGHQSPGDGASVPHPASESFVDLDGAAWVAFQTEPPLAGTHKSPPPPYAVQPHGQQAPPAAYEPPTSHTESYDLHPKEEQKKPQGQASPTDHPCKQPGKTETARTRVLQLSCSFTFELNERVCLKLFTLAWLAACFFLSCSVVMALLRRPNQQSSIEIHVEQQMSPVKANHVDSPVRQKSALPDLGSVGALDHRKQADVAGNVLTDAVSTTDAPQVNARTSGEKTDSEMNSSSVARGTEPGKNDPEMARTMALNQSNPSRRRLLTTRRRRRQSELTLT